MIKHIVTAAIVTVAMTSSASACSFFTKLAYAGHCTEEAWVADKKASVADSGKPVVIDNNNVWVNVDGVVTRIEKNELQGKSDVKAYIIERVGEELAGQIENQVNADVVEDAVLEYGSGSALEAAIADATANGGVLDAETIAQLEAIDEVERLYQEEVANGTLGQEFCASDDCGNGLSHGDAIPSE